MLLLILQSDNDKHAYKKFTFHYASTYTFFPAVHQTRIFSFTFHYASTYTMSTALASRKHCIFTFHYASTYTRLRPNTKYAGRNLHSTMLLLIPSYFVDRTHITRIYIPLCFYLYCVVNR